MTVDEVNHDYSALLDQIEGTRRQYHSFPMPDALSEEHLVESRAKQRIAAITGKVLSYVEFLLGTLRSIKVSQGKESTTASECEDSVCLGRVCEMFRTVCSVMVILMYLC